MATQVQLRRGTDSEHSTFVGANGEVTVNTDNDSVHVHDGATAGGFEAMRADASNAQNDVITNDMLSLNANDGEIKKALNSDNAPPIYACRAWVNFDGTGTVSIRDSGNVSSITDNGEGDYTVNFATAMEDANYCFNLTASVTTGNSVPRALEHLEPNTKTNTAINVTARLTDRGNTFKDIENANVSIFR